MPILKTVLILGVLFLAGLSQAMPFEQQLTLPQDYDSRRITRYTPLETGGTITLLDVKGPGSINHIWFTTRGDNDFRKIILRMYWDGETDPSVEAPLTDFFGVGHNLTVTPQFFSTRCLVIAPNNGYNCYFPMPFRQLARITLTNEQEKDVAGNIYFQADYRIFRTLSPDVPYFHAQWRREAPALRRAAPFTIIQALGKGFLAGMTYHIRRDDDADHWVHGGGDMLYLDAQINPYFINGIGGEDSFGASWSDIQPFISPYTGCTMQQEGKVSLYRFYTDAPVQFQKSVRLAFGAMKDEITSVGYWYQSEPHHRFYNLPPSDLRDPASTIGVAAYDVELAQEQQIPVAVIGPFEGDIATELPPEKSIDLTKPLTTNYKAVYKTTYAKVENSDAQNQQRLVRWEHARTTLGWLDFAALYKPKMKGPITVQLMPNAIAYTLIRVTSDESRLCPLLIGHDDALRLWLNGQLIADMPARQAFQGEKVDLTLQAGTNNILLKVPNDINENLYAYAVSLFFPDRSGLTFDDFLNLPAAPDHTLVE